MNNFRLLREQKGLTQEEFRRQFNNRFKRTYTAAAISQFENDKRKPEMNALIDFATFYNVSIDYLLGNPVPLYHNKDKVLGNKTPLFSDVPKENRRIPIIGTVRCGPDGLAYEYIDGYEWIDSDIAGDIRAFHCKGDSMTGLGIFDGDIAIVRIQSNIENGELAVVVINGDEGTLKRVRYHDGVIILEAGNPDYPPRVFSGKEANTVHIVGKVLETRRKY